MGCGKSYVARNLAPKLRMQHIDLDQVIVDYAQKSIPQIFETEGEAAFRRIEQACLRQSFSLDNTIISTGGGAPCFFDNMAQMKQAGTTIFLDVSLPVMIKRLQRGLHKRPLLANKTSEELEAFIQKKLAERRAFYEQAHIVHVQKSESQPRIEELIMLLAKVLQ